MTFPEGERQPAARRLPVLKRELTNSEMSCFAQCTEKHRIRYIEGYVPVRTAPALRFGTAVHQCMEAYWRARKANAANPVGSMLAAVPSDMDGFERARLRVMLIAYAAVWGRVACKVLAVELPFDLPLVNPDTGETCTVFRRAGKIDLILEFPGRIVRVTEHKSSSEDPGPGSPYARRLTLDEQVSFYLRAAQYMGYQPESIVYDVLRKFRVDPLEATPEATRYLKDGKTLRKNAREQDETPAEYEARLVEVAKSAPEKIVSRIAVQRFEHEVERFDREIWARSRMMLHVMREQLATRNSRACFQHHGSGCEYLDVCSGHGRLDDEFRFLKLVDTHPELRG